MKKAFSVYVVLTLAGVAFRAAQDLNNFYKWFEGGSSICGVGISLAFLGGAVYIDSTKKKGWARVFTRCALFTAISILCDAVLFDPFVVSWKEWLTAAVVVLAVYLYRRGRGRV